MVAGFQSILFEHPASGAGVDELSEPDFFVDLNLDQVLASMTAGREQYKLKPFFFAPLHQVAAVRYRHEVLRDLEKAEVLEPIRKFAGSMRLMREHLAQVEKLHYQLQKQSWFLDAVEIYCEAVRSLAEDLAERAPSSRGLRGLRDYLDGYAASERFTSLAAGTKALKDALARVRYAVRINGARVTVSKYAGEADYSAEVEETFARFQQGAVRSHLARLPDYAEMDHVEAKILDGVAQLYPDVFRARADFCVRHRDYLDATIGRFDREVQFYLAYLEMVERLRGAGLPFCYPHVSARSTGDRRRARRSISRWPTSWCPRAASSSATTSTWRRRSGCSSSPGRTTAARRRSPAPSGSCTTSPVSACSSPAAKRGSSCPTGSSRTSSGRRTSKRSAASSTTSSSGSTRSLSGRPRTVSSS